MAPLSKIIFLGSFIFLSLLILLSTQRADERGSDGLNIRQFKAAFSQILNWKNEEQLISMFKKIDTKSAGTIDWVKNCCL